MSASVAFYSK